MSTPNETRPTSARTWIARGVGAVVLLVALVYGGIFFYAKVLNDAPDALDRDDLASALETPADTGPADTTPGDTVAPATTESADTTPTADGFDGVWTPTAASEFGYRVDEVLGGVNVTAVGRSNEIEGSLTVAGTTASVEVLVQVENIRSDDSRRDGQFRGRIMDATNFPTATFRTTSPIDFGELPAAGEQITATAIGELTLKGVTQPVEFQVTAQTTGGSIGVLGSIPVVFADYGIDNPSVPGVTTEDDGLVEFVLVFERG